MSLNLQARPRAVGDVWSVVRDLQRQVEFLRSARAVTLRSLLTGLVEGADSVAGAALAAAVIAQESADAAAVLKSGTDAGTTDMVGEFTITHPLGSAPGLAIAQIVTDPDLTAGFVSATSTTATFVLVDRATGAAASTAYSCRWAVIA